MKNVSRRRFLKHIVPAGGGWWLTANFSFAATFLKVKEAAAQLVPLVAARVLKTILIPGSGNLLRTKDGLTLTSTNLPLLPTDGIFWSDIAWNGSVYCAVGGGGSSATTTDFTTWTQHVTPFHDGAVRIINKGTMFVLLPRGVTNKIATSTDGATWTQNTLPISSQWSDIIWTGSLFCLVPNGAAVAFTSTDAITWTQRTLPAVANGYRVVWDGSVFCISNYDGSVMTSPDAITWTARAGIGSDIVDAYAVSGNIYLVSYTIPQVYVSSNGGVSFSPLGVNASSSLMSIIVNGTLVLASRLGGSVQYSTNSAASWSSVTTFTSSNFGGMRYINSTYIQMGMQQFPGFNGCCTSTNGSTWTTHQMPVAYDAVQYTKVAVAGSKMCGITYSKTNGCGYSSDYGTTWSTGTFPITSGWATVAGNGTIFCAFPNAASSSMYTSSDGGATWTTRALPVTLTWVDATWNGSLFCAISNASTNIALTSADGITWTQQTLPSTQTWIRVIWNGTLFVAVSSSAAVAATSPDGTTWTQRTLPVAASWLDICWTGTSFVLVASNNTCLTSSDGVTWTTKTNVPGGVTVRFIIWNGAALIALGPYATSISHDLGTTWTSYARATYFGYVSNLGGVATVNQ